MCFVCKSKRTGVSECPLRGGSVAASEAAPGVRAALNALLYRTGELSRDVVLVIATNRPEDLDSAGFRLDGRSATCWSRLWF